MYVIFNVHHLSKLLEPFFGCKVDYVCYTPVYLTSVIEVDIGERTELSSYCGIGTNVVCCHSRQLISKIELLQVLEDDVGKGGCIMST